jgi:hypothetical protein
MSSWGVLTDPAKAAIRGQEPVAATPIAMPLAARNCRRETPLGSIIMDPNYNKASLLCAPERGEGSRKIREIRRCDQQ